MHRPPQRSSCLADIKAAMRQIELEAQELEAKMAVDFEGRDIAVCADLWQRKADLYTELMECDEWITT